MTRILLALAGVILLAVTALAAVWLLGQLLTGLGLFIVGAAGVLGRLLWFLLITGVLAGVVYFVASAWRPSVRAPVRPYTAQPEARRPAPGRPKRGRSGKRAEPTPVPPASPAPSSVAPANPAPAAPSAHEQVQTEPVQTEPAPPEAPETVAAPGGPVRSGG
ncbi:hypothetical protein [Deinococcus xianganensis]|uniref:hypothetical protein n=1 Tax=Deinococcus xianganensis TaxID=1507289 RepID=UPI001F3BC1A1|nr:hypothetical protein [Deinococcus xianganensis]